jgi:hypothetical protein
MHFINTMCYLYLPFTKILPRNAFNETETIYPPIFYIIISCLQ